MDNFFRYFYQDFGRVFRAFTDVIVAFFNFLNYLLNFPMRVEIMKQYEEEFGTLDWILLLVVNLALIALIVVLCVLFAKLLNLFSKKKVNPMIGAAGISAFPMSGRIVHKMAQEEDPQNFLLMHSIGVNVSGQIASVIAGGIILNIAAKLMGG